MRPPFPFSAIAGQEQMKTALLLAAIDHTIGGVLVFGDRGTGKSTAVRALAALLPKIPVEQDQATTVRRKTQPVPVVDLPLGAT
ncbi:MAG: ATP-binding protein, partial [Pseudomonadota bacterium]